MNARHDVEMARTAPASAPRPEADPAWLDRRDLELLAQIGFSAAARGLDTRVELIFEALAQLRPGNAAAAIGRALVALSRGEPQAAIELLHPDAVAAPVNGQEAKALLAAALAMAGRRQESAALVRELMAGPDGAAKELAQRLLAKNGRE
jgi:hypothetical protein